MPTYEYRAKTPAGEDVTGLIQADNEMAVTRTLDEKQLFPIRVAEQAERRGPVGRRVRIRDVAICYGQLADLLRAGVPMLRALQTVARATRSAHLAHVLRAVHDEISAGETMADAVAQHPDVFSPLHAAMIRAGEQAGFLEDVLTNLGEFLERQDELRSRVRGAMIYPLILVAFGIAAVTVILVHFVPKFRKFFGSTDLPLPTRILFAISDGLRQWPVLVAGVVAVAACVVALWRSRAVRMAWARWQLKLPLLGRLLRTICVSRFCRILGTMLHNGVPILQALAISKDATGNAMLAERIEDAAESVRAGQTLADPLRGDDLFPPEILEMMAVAEESNQLEKVLVQIAETVDRRTERQLDVLVRLIEPLILVMIAAVIGMVAVGLLYPIFTIADRLG